MFVVHSIGSTQADYAVTFMSTKHGTWSKTPTRSHAWHRMWGRDQESQHVQQLSSKLSRKEYECGITVDGTLEIWMGHFGSPSRYSYLGQPMHQRCLYKRRRLEKHAGLRCTPVPCGGCAEEDRRAGVVQTPFSRWCTWGLFSTN